MTALLESPAESHPVEQQQTPPQGEAIFTFALRTLDQYSDYCWFENVLSPEDVNRVLTHANLIEPESATVGGDRGLDYGIRKSVVRWLRPCEANFWLFRRITDLVWSCNQVRYGFDLRGLNEGLQVAEYAPGAFFSWHKDSGNGVHSIRKLSVTIQLSDPADYEGGDMEFLFGPEITTAPKAIGTAIVFPSYIMHRVTPVTRGHRRSVVAWISGPPYR